MKKVLIAVVVLGLVGAGGYGVYQHFFADSEKETQRVSSDSEDAVYVDSVATITGQGSGNGLTERYGGEVNPQATLEIKLESEKKVKECFVKEGDKVSEGQRLFVYDTQEDEDKLAQAEIDIEKAQGDIEISERAITQYEKEKNNASADDQLSITTSILTEQNEIKRNEYEIKSKQLEIENLKESIANSTVTAEMGGIIQKIQDPDSSSSSYSMGSDSSAYITILADGDFRVKGLINEQNISQLDTGMEMIVYSRVDDTKTWFGTISEIDTDNKEEDSSESMYYSMSGSAESSSYAFYVELENSEGLILGQHVYMEPNNGQNEEKEGLWLEDYYIVQEEDEAYVWAASESNVIEKRQVTLGDYDDALMKYEITDGLSTDDYIAFPGDTVSEGLPVIYNDYDSQSMDMGGMDMEGMDMGGSDMGGIDMEGMDADSLDMEGMDVDSFDMEGLDMEGMDEEAVDMEGADVYTDDGMEYGEDVYTDDGSYDEEYPDGEVLDLDEEF